MNAISRPPLTGRLRRRLATVPWRRHGRAARHLMLGFGLFTLGWWLFEWGNHERAAARAGDPQVIAARHAIRVALHAADAVSLLEHALSGIGMAVVGVGILQVYYFIWQPVRAGASLGPRWARALLATLACAGAAAFAWRLTYGHTGWLVVPPGLLAIAWALARPDQLAHVAIDRPGAFIALAGGLVWLNFDLGWKVQQWPATHDTLGIVCAHLLASGATLVVCGLMTGALIRRCAALRPVGA